MSNQDKTFTVNGRPMENALEQRDPGYILQDGGIVGRSSGEECFWHVGLHQTGN